MADIVFAGAFFIAASITSYQALGAPGAVPPPGRTSRRARNSGASAEAPAAPAATAQASEGVQAPQEKSEDGEGGLDVDESTGTGTTGASDVRA